MWVVTAPCLFGAGLLRCRLWCVTTCLPQSSKRPENEGPAELYYNETRAAQYTTNTRVMSIQSAMTQRAVELLNFPEGEPKLILDCEFGGTTAV